MTQKKAAPRKKNAPAAPWTQSRMKALVKELLAAERAAEKARTRLAKIKAQKRPRKATLEEAEIAHAGAKVNVADVLGKLAALNTERGAREANPVPGTPAPAPASADDGLVSEASIIVVMEAIVVAGTALEDAMLMLEKRLENPHVRGYTRSTRVRPHERGDTRFFGRSSR